MTTPVRVVLDTNVALSALVFRGSAAGQVRLAWQNGLIVPLASTHTAQELVRVLAYPKFRLSLLEQEELLADYLPHTQAVRVPKEPPQVPDCRDPQNVPFIHLAMAGKARVLVSGDRDLLILADELEGASGCQILSLDAFVRGYLTG